MSWTQKEMDDLYLEMQKKAMVDEKFRKELLEDSARALESLAGKKLPEGCKIKVIENDPSYSATFVLPDLISEEFSPEDLDKASGGEGSLGVSFMLIISACAAAVSTVACPADACAAQGCLADVACAAQACAARGTTV